MLSRKRPGNCHHGHRCCDYQKMEWSICTTPLLRRLPTLSIANDGDRQLHGHQLSVWDWRTYIPFLRWGTRFSSTYDKRRLEGPGLCLTATVYPIVDKEPWGTSYAERPLLFHNIGGKQFEFDPAVEGTALDRPMLAAAWGRRLVHDGKARCGHITWRCVPTLLRQRLARQTPLDPSSSWSAAEGVRRDAGRRHRFCHRQ